MIIIYDQAHNTVMQTSLDIGQYRFACLFASAAPDGDYLLTKTLVDNNKHWHAEYTFTVHRQRVQGFKQVHSQ